MSKRRKLVLTAVAVILVIGGVLGGAAIAAARHDETLPQEQAQENTLLDKIAEIYEENTGTALDTEELKSAFQQARRELNAERQQAILDRLVEEGIITQEEADEYQAWLDARPDISIGPFNAGKDMPFGRMHRGGMRGFQGWCLPDTEPTVTQ